LIATNCLRPSTTLQKRPLRPVPDWTLPFSEASALLLASNFRFTTEDVDIAELGVPWPQWLIDAVAQITKRNGWSETWFNDAVSFHLSAHAQADRDLVEWRAFSRSLEQVGLTVFVPTAEHMLALKLKADRVSDFAKGSQDLSDR
jgi:hypothetical protein